MLRAFLEASYMGWRDVMENPKSALEIFKKRVPEIDLSIIEPNMMMGLDLMKTDRYARHGRSRNSGRRTVFRAVIRAVFGAGPQAWPPQAQAQVRAL